MIIPIEKIEHDAAINPHMRLSSYVAKLKRQQKRLERIQRLDAPKTNEEKSRLFSWFDTWMGRV